MYSGTTKSRTDLEIGIRHQHTSPQIMLSITNPRSRTSGYGAGSRCPSRAKTSHRLKTTKGRKTDPIAANAAFRVAASISSNETQDQPPPWLIQAANISSRGRTLGKNFGVCCLPRRSLGEGGHRRVRRLLRSILCSANDLVFNAIQILEVQSVVARRRIFWIFSWWTHDCRTYCIEFAMQSVDFGARFRFKCKMM